MAAVRADYDAKVAELMAELEGTRGEKEKAETDLAFLKASARKERLQWNKDRAVLSRKVSEADARARQAADGVASPEEFLALQQALANRDETIQGMRKVIDEKEAQQGKLLFEVECASTAEADVECLMVRVASLEKELAQERDERLTAEQEVETQSAEGRRLERRLVAAQEAAIRAEDDAAICAQDVERVTTEMREAHAAQRHAELWLEKSLSEIDAVHAVLAYERSEQTPRLHPEPPSPAYGGPCSATTGANTEVREVTLGPTSQTPNPQSRTAVLRAAAGGAKQATPSSSGSQCSNLRTPDLDATRPLLFSATRSRPGAGDGRRETEWAGDVEEATTILGRGDRSHREYSPPNPTVLFGELAGDGESTLWGKQDPGGDNGIRHYGNAKGGAMSGSTFAQKTSDAVHVKPSSVPVDTPAYEAPEADVAASPVSLLRSERSRREKAEARIAELECAAAAAAAAPIAADLTAETAGAHRASTVDFQAEQARSTGCAPGGADVCPCVRLHGCGVAAGQPTAMPDPPARSEQFDSETYAAFARMDQERQKVKFLALVREARKRMPLAEGCSGVGNHGHKGGGGKSFGASGGGGFPADESAFCQLNPASEVASLIQEFEGKLTRSVDDNAQLRDFCAHLEGLLAVHQGKSGGEDPPAFVVGSCLGGFVPSPAGARGSKLSKAAGGNGKHSTNPLAVCREPFGDRRMRVSFPGSAQD